jgi:hypothetical protein
METDRHTNPFQLPGDHRNGTEFCCNPSRREGPQLAADLNTVITFLTEVLDFLNDITTITTF